MAALDGTRSADEEVAAVRKQLQTVDTHAACWSRRS